MMSELTGLLQVLVRGIQFAAIDLRDRQHGQIRELHPRQLMLLSFVDTAHEIIASLAYVPALIPCVAEAAVGSSDIGKRVRLTCMMQCLLMSSQTRIDAAERKT